MVNSKSQSRDLFEDASGGEGNSRPTFPYPLPSVPAQLLTVACTRGGCGSPAAGHRYRSALRSPWITGAIYWTDGPTVTPYMQVPQFLFRQAGPPGSVPSWGSGQGSHTSLLLSARPQQQGLCPFRVYAFLLDQVPPPPPTSSSSAVESPPFSAVLPWVLNG